MPRPKVTTPAPTGTDALRARGLRAFVVGLDPEVHRQLKIAAATEGRPANQVAASAISDYLSRTYGKAKKSG